jgi:hypothetical protein
MPTVFDALPGIEVPVDSIKKSLARMWDATAKAGGPAPAADDVKATQMNFVVHLGFATTAEDATAQFQTMLCFSKRYPSRVVVLCPLAEEHGEKEFRAKIYGECFLGKSKGDTRCVEFVALSYPIVARRHLEDQVSVCLSTDLPLYYWAHRFSASGRLADYQYLLRSSKRVIFDTSIVPADAWTYQWPKPEAVRDLVYARLLPVRQSLGQFLSGFSPERLTEGLQGVRVGHTLERAAEARVLLSWLHGRLEACGAPAGLPGEVGAPTRLLGDGLEVRFDYAGGSSFSWFGDLAKQHAEFSANFGGGSLALTTSISLLSPEAALSEAVFF